MMIGRPGTTSGMNIGGVTPSKTGATGAGAITAHLTITITTTITIVIVIVVTILVPESSISTIPAPRVKPKL